MQTKMIFKQNLTNDSCKQIEKTQGQIVGTKMGSIAGNDQNTHFICLYAKNLQIEAVTYAVEAQ